VNRLLRLPTCLLIGSIGLLASCEESSPTSPTANPTPALLDTASFGIPWNSAIAYGIFQDQRDGQAYRTVTIGTQTWMARNLNYRNATGKSDTAGVCYNYSADSCSKFGRLYTWAEAMQGAASSSAKPSGIQGICPSNWHVPSDSEWAVLQKRVDPTNARDGAVLKATNDWKSALGSEDGIDSLGFRAIAAGQYNAAYLNLAPNNPFLSAGRYTAWWSSTQYQGSTGVLGALVYQLDLADPRLFRGYFGDGHKFPVRCLKNP